MFAKPSRLPQYLNPLSQLSKKAISLSMSSFSFLNSSSVNVIPLPIFSRLGPQARISYFGSLPFHITRLNSNLHPFSFSEITPNSFAISNFTSLFSFAIISTPYTEIWLVFCRYYATLIPYNRVFFP